MHSRKFCDIRITFKINWKKHFRPILIIFATGIATQIYVNSDITILGILKSDYSVGIYSVSSKIYNIVKTLAQALVIVTVPRLSMLLGKRKMEEFNTLLLRVTSMLAMVTIPATFGLYMLAPQVIVLISGVSYLRGVPSLRLLCLALLVSVFSWVFAYCVLLPDKRENKFLISASKCSIKYCSQFLLLIPLMSENGVALTTSIAEVLMLALIVYYSRDILKDVYTKAFWRDIVVYVFGSFFIVLICIIIDNLIDYVFLQLILAVGISAFTYGIILLLFRNQYCLEILRRFMKSK